MPNAELSRTAVLDERRSASRRCRLQRAVALPCRDSKHPLQPWNHGQSNAVWAGPVSALRRVALSAYAADGIPKAYSKRPAVQWV